VHFQHGSIYWSPATGAHVVTPELRDAWAASGWENGPLGYPVTDAAPLANGGKFVHFQGGSVYWSPATGAHVVRGPVRDAWAATGWETGPLGYPTGDLRAVSGGTRQDFQRGYITVSGATGVATVHKN
jgi:uncharacterized protein with LGFP repeats